MTASTSRAMSSRPWWIVHNGFGGDVHQALDQSVCAPEDRSVASLAHFGNRRIEFHIGEYQNRYEEQLLAPGSPIGCPSTTWWRPRSGAGGELFFSRPFWVVRYHLPFSSR